MSRANNDVSLVLKVLSVLDQGRSVEDGTYEELIDGRGGAYASMWTAAA